MVGDRVEIEAHRTRNVPGQELGFGVVEMEEELRNGIVLAKLVRKFKGEAGARRIYEV